MAALTANSSEPSGIGPLKRFTTKVGGTAMEFMDSIQINVDTLVELS